MEKFVLFTTGGGSADPLNWSNDEAALYPVSQFKGMRPASSRTIDMFFETYSSKAGNITCVADDLKFGNLTMAGGTGTGATGAHTRSALIVPRADPSGVNIVITFANSGDDLTVLVLAKD